jgi:hypothetical protein
MVALEFPYRKMPVPDQRGQLEQEFVEDMSYPRFYPK